MPGCPAVLRAQTNLCKRASTEALTGKPDNGLKESQLRLLQTIMLSV